MPKLSDSDIIEKFHPDVFELLEKVIRHKLGARHNLAEDAMDTLWGIGYELVETIDGEKISNVVKLEAKLKARKEKEKLEKIYEDAEKEVNDATDKKNLAYSVAANLLNAVRHYRLSLEAEVPKTSEDKLNELFEELIKLDKKLEGLEG